MIQNQPLISIIIPVYNAKKTLSVCLDSLYAQTYKSLELLFIDDCCSDDSFEVINGYISQNKSDHGIVTRIFRHEQNRGVAAARNTGLDHARGEYVYYVDADDIIEPEALFELVKKAQYSDADITGCEWFLSYPQNERHMKQPEIVSPIDAFRKMTGGILRWNLWIFLVKRSLYENNDIRFIEGMNMGEDMMVMGKLFLCADKVAMLHKPFYHYMQTNFTYMEAETSRENRLHVTRNILELERFARIRWGDFDEKMIHFLKLNIKLPLLITQDTSAYRQWLLWFPEANAYILQNKMLSLRLRLLQWMAAKEQFWFLKLYYKLIIRFVYGVLYK